MAHITQSYPQTYRHLRPVSSIEPPEPLLRLAPRAPQKKCCCYCSSLFITIVAAITYNSNIDNSQENAIFLMNTLSALPSRLRSSRLLWTSAPASVEAGVFAMGVAGNSQMPKKDHHDKKTCPGNPNNHLPRITTPYVRALLSSKERLLRDRLPSPWPLLPHEQFQKRRMRPTPNNTYT